MLASRAIDLSSNPTTYQDLLSTIGDVRRTPNMTEVRWLPGENDIAWHDNTNGDDGQINLTT